MDNDDSKTLILPTQETVEMVCQNWPITQSEMDAIGFRLSDSEGATARRVFQFVFGEELYASLAKK